jgi:hypothetical protein
VREIALDLGRTLGALHRVWLVGRLIECAA